MSQKLLNRIFSAVAAFSLLVNSLSAPLAVYAQEVTPEPTIVEEIPTPTPTVTATQVETVTPTEAPTVSVTPTEDPSFTPTDIQPEEPQGTVEAVTAPTEAVTEEPATSFPEPDLSEAQTEGTSAQLVPSISTDKGDYSPTDTVLITGAGFAPNTEYTIEITSDTGNYKFSDRVTSDESGNIFYSFQLDGRMRPLYKAEIKDSSGNVIATTTFTDPPVYLYEIDTAGANDEPGQKDLTRMGVDYAELPTTLYTTWQWDEISWSGNNTGDACNLFDTDGDGNANFSLCVTISGSPATIQTTTLYTCNDANPDKCNGNSSVTTNASCSVQQEATDPFSGTGQDEGDEYPNDTVGYCTIPMSDFLPATTSSLLDVCSYPSAQPNSDPSDCIVFQEKTGKLEVKKILDPSSDSGLFNLFIGNQNYGAVDVGDGGTTGEQILDAAQNGTAYSVKETAGTGTTLTSYTTGIVCKDLNGTGTIVAQSNDPGPLTVTLNVGDDIVCTITNTLQPGTLHVIKTVNNDNGGALNAVDFTFSVNSGPAVAFETDGQNDLTVEAGTYTVTEPAVTGYSTSYDDCTDVVVPAGGSATCTITNNDVQPLLTVTKIVINDNGGELEVADFPLFVDETSVTSGAQNGFNAGSYVVSETGQTGYTSVISGNCDSQGNVNLAVGDVKSCTIINNDVAPTLTLVKTVSNDNGGTKVVSNFPLFINGNPVTSGVANNLLANVLYTATETTSLGYAPSDWGGDCTTGGTITLSPGDNKTCTITNDDIQPRLTVTKFVVNDNNGNALIENFALYVGSTQVLSGVENGFDAGSYFVSEVELEGYTASDWGGDCATDGSITLEVGGVYLCTITNDDQAASITLIKSVTNNNGGNAGVNDFGLTIGGTPVTSGQVLSVNSNTPYALNEAGLTGYSFVSITGEGCPQSLGGTVTLNEGESVTCTITNDDEAPTITLVKNVINDNGGNAGVNDFGLTIGGNPTTSGTPVEVLANTLYALNEAGLAGYTFLGMTGDPECPGGPDALGESTILNEGQDVTCTIINDDNTASITLIKEVTNNNGGNAGVNDFGLTIGGTGVSSGQIFYVDANEPYALDEAGLPGYSFVSITGDNKCPDALGGSVTPDEGESVTCTIANDDEAPTITLIKDVNNNFGGQAGENNFGLTIGGNSVDSGVETEVDANEDIALDEAGLAGYQFVSITGEGCPTELGGTVNLNEGEDITCTITNEDIQPLLTVTKVVEGSEYLEPEDFNLYVDTTQVSSGVQNGFNAGDYVVSEDPVDGYTSVISGDCDENGNVTLALTDEKACTITNTRDTGEIIIHKVIDQDGDWETNADWLPGEDWAFSVTSEGEDTSNPTVANTDGNGDTSTGNIKTGEYDVIETVQPGWVLLIAGCGENGDFDQTDSVDGISVGKDETVECTFVNFLPEPALTTTKVRSASTPEEILIGENSVMEITITNSGNVPIYDVFAIDFFDTDYVDFVSASPTEYIFFEDVGEDTGDYDNDGDFDEHIGFIVWDIGDMEPGESLTLFVTFIATAISPDSPEQVLAWNGAGSAGCTENDEDCSEEDRIESDLSFANVDVDSLGIQIDKSNDKSGGANAGDEVTYTLVVTNTGEGTAFNVEVEDNLPGGFNYVNGTTEINGSASGDPTVTGGGSTLTWNIGNVSNGEPVTIVYKAKIGDSVTPGTYKNYATCREVFGETNGILTDNFEINRIVRDPLECNVDNSDVQIGQSFSYGGQLTPQVLGAATELPATGSSTNLLIFALVVGGFGIFAKMKAHKMGRRKYAKN